MKTPDLEGALGLDHVLRQVKTINPSDEDVAARIGPEGSVVTAQIHS